MLERAKANETNNGDSASGTTVTIPREIEKDAKESDLA